MAADWQIRFEGTSRVMDVDAPARVLDGLRAGEWDATDEVKGPSDADWKPIEDHPAFADVANELSPPRIDPPDETKLDMNPLIDVSLVLLIFFILTTSYASLRRSIDVPPEPDAETGKKLSEKDVKDAAFNVTVWMDNGIPRIKLEDRIVDLAELEREMIAMVRATGRRQVILAIEGAVPWGIEAAVHDAAKGAEINQIYGKAYRPGK